MKDRNPTLYFTKKPLTLFLKATFTATTSSSSFLFFFTKGAIKTDEKRNEHQSPTLNWAEIIPNFKSSWSNRILSSLAHVSHSLTNWTGGVLHSPLCELHLLRQSPPHALDVVQQPRQWRKCGDPKSTGGQEPGQGQPYGNYSRDQNGAKDNEKRRCHRQPDESPDENQPGKAKQGSTKWKERDNCYHLWSWWTLLRRKEAFDGLCGALLLVVLSHAERWAVAYE